MSTVGKRGTAEPLNWIETHKCWVDLRDSRWHESDRKGILVLSIGHLDELRHRAHCDVCLQIYQLLEAEITSKFGGVANLRAEQTLCEFAYYERNHEIVLRLTDNSIVLNLDAADLPRSMFKHLSRTRIDAADIRAWIMDCDKNHITCKSVRPKHLGHHTVIMIDVVDDCLVSTILSIEYVALSYTWGGKAGLTLRRANFKELYMHGSLREQQEYIPKTIRDAMLLTSTLGRRYLWVDALCIVQDDEINKVQQIQLMSSIYTGASFTIVAADGSHADHGLLGIGATHRQPPQAILSFSLSQKFIIDLNADVPSHPTPYFQRGWTYQEFYLSNRLLVFYRSSVLWRCHENSYREGSSKPISVFNFLPGYINEHDLLHALGWPRFSSYANLVNEYNSRRLSYDTDALHAFTGILNRLMDIFSGGFLQALPELYFDIALLWQSFKPLRRRQSQSHQYPLPSWSWVGWDGILETDWSFVIESPMIQDPEHGAFGKGPVVTLPITTWYKSSSISGQRIRIDNSYYQYYKLRVPTVFGLDEQKKIDEMNNYAAIEGSLGSPGVWMSGWTLSSRVLGSDNTYTSESRDVRPCWVHSDLEHAFKYPIPMNRPSGPLDSPDMQYLHCRTHRTFLDLGTVVYQEKEWSSAYVTILGKDEAIVGVLNLNAAVHVRGMHAECEMIAISRGYCDMVQKPETWLHETRNLDCLLEIAHMQNIKLDVQTQLPNYLEYLRQRIRYYEFYNVMWIERKDGIAYRKAVGRVFKKAWERLALEEIDVVLG
ncbi:heterokaryon incompatibility protein-domain-containing protein [Lophiotrema nucula]|uniref:Heterokaryon incompatibility protein-domain-containing protein n=1 Tax=Lophiotrema nucula TaxID=690887 RepID=A0A6A5ZRD7_9PLEO|nr:heterokaryon incompatibility protein-domain-containing protein [Lophiotrema nucula]